MSLALVFLVLLFLETFDIKIILLINLQSMYIFWFRSPQINNFDNSILTNILVRAGHPLWNIGHDIALTDKIVSRI